MDGPSPFIVNVYQHNSVGQDKLVGTLTDTIDGVLGRLEDGGMQLKYLLEGDADGVVAFKCL